MRPRIATSCIFLGDPAESVYRLREHAVESSVQRVVHRGERAAVYLVLRVEAVDCVSVESGS
jgi:hypothetical protein